MGKLFNDVKAAELLGLNVQTLRNWRFNGTGPAYIKIGRSVKYSEDDIKAYIETQRVEPHQCQA